MEAIEDIEISDSNLGEAITIGCRVTTCRYNAEIVLAKGFDILNRAVLSSDATNVILNTELVASDNVTGSYECRVTRDGILYQTFFRITRRPSGNFDSVRIHHSNFALSLCFSF